MTELSSTARQLIESARGGDEITDAERHRVTQGLATRLGTAALGGAAASASLASVAAAAGSTAAQSGTGVLAIAIWGAGGVGLGLAAMGLVTVLGAPASPRVSDTPATVQQPEARPSSARLGGTTNDRELSQNTEMRPSSAASVSRARRAGEPVQPAISSRAMDAPTASGSLNEEVALLREAHAALQTSDARRALALLEDHEARFPSGVLREERAAQRIFALCSAGRATQAAAEAQRFVQNAPRSPLVPRVLASCVNGSVY